MTRRVSTLVLMFVLYGAVAAAAQGPDGAALFEAQCARCHTEPGVQRAPLLEAMRDRSPDAIVTALTSGTMALQGQDLTILDLSLIHISDPTRLRRSRMPSSA